MVFLNAAAEPKRLESLDKMIENTPNKNIQNLDRFEKLRMLSKVTAL